MRIDLLPIRECIWQHDPDATPKDLFGTDDRLVSHPVEEDGNIEDLSIYEFEYSKCFLDAANFIVINLPQKLGPIEDQMMFPLISLCVHSIENSLKYMLIKLIDHIQKYHPNEEKSYKSLLDHNLVSLVIDIRKLLVQNGSQNTEPFELIAEFVKGLSDVDATSMSARYVIDKKKSICKLRKKGLVLIPGNLVKNTENIFYWISEYVNRIE